MVKFFIFPVICSLQLCRSETLTLLAFNLCWPAIFLNRWSKYWGPLLRVSSASRVLDFLWGFPATQMLPAMQETQVLSLGQEDPLEKGMATDSSMLAWETPA